jgi:hypothetical protein
MNCRYRLPHEVRGKSCGDKRPFLDELIATTEFHQKHQKVQRDENVCDDRKRATLGVAFIVEPGAGVLAVVWLIGSFAGGGLASGTGSWMRWLPLMMQRCR